MMLRSNQSARVRCSGQINQLECIDHLKESIRQFTSAGLLVGTFASFKMLQEKQACQLLPISSFAVQQQALCSMLSMSGEVL